MKKKLFTVILIQFLLFNVSFGQLSKKTMTNGSHFLEFLPPGYNDSQNAARKYPVIIYLHGCGEIAYHSGGNCPSVSPSDYISNWQAELDKLLGVGPNHEIMNGSDMSFRALGTTGPKQGFIVITPQLNNGNVRYAWDNSNIEGIIKYALANYRVERKMLYLTGYSLGGNATYGYSMSTKYFADSLAAIAPVSAKTSTTNACLLSVRKTPVWALHGDQDTANGNSYLSDRNFINALLACAPTPVPAPRFTAFAGLGHVQAVWLKSFSATKGPDAADLVSDTLTIYKWFLRNPKGGLTANQLPTANAGIDKIVNVPIATVIFTGAGSDSDGTIVSYAWSQVSGATLTLANSNQATVSVNNPPAGVYTLKLTVTDNAGGTTSDNVVLTCNQPPTVSAGADVVITLPTNSLTLNATSSDVDGTVVSTLWSQISGPSSATLSNPNSLLSNVSNLIEGSYLFRLTATDNFGSSAFDDVLVTVHPVPPAGSWIQVTSKGLAGKAVLLYYNSQKSNSSQQLVRASGNDSLQFYIKKISGVTNFINLKVELIVAFQSRFLYIGNYASNIGTNWTKVSIPLIDFGHDPAKWTSGGVSVVDFKTISGFGTGVFGVDEIRFTGGTSPFVWYGNAYETSASPASVTQDTTAIFISNRFTDGGAPVVSGGSNVRATSQAIEMNTHNSLITFEKAKPSLEEGDILHVYNTQGQLIKKLVYNKATSDLNNPDLLKYSNQSGFVVFKVFKGTGKVETMKISLKE